MRIDSSYVSEYESFGWHNTSYIQTVDMTVFFCIVKMLQIENFLVYMCVLWREIHTNLSEC